MAETFVTAEQLAARVGTSVDTIRRRCRQGTMPGAERVGRMWLIPADAARAFARGYEPYGSLRKARPAPDAAPAEQETT